MLAGLRHTLLRNQLGGENVWHDGYEYHFNAPSYDRQTWYWRCVKRFKPGVMCRATFHTDVGGGNPRMGRNGHNQNCPAEPNRLMGRLAVVEAKTAAEMTGTRIGTIVKSIGARLHPDVAVWFPKKDSIRRVACRARRTAQGGVNLGANTLDGIVLTPQMCRHPWDIQRTLLVVDTGAADPERIMIFATDETLDLLEVHHQWSGDGTFSSAPCPFEQLYTIHLTIDGKTVPALFALMVNRERALYERMLNLLMIARPGIQNNPPTHLMTDFETAAYNAFAQTFAGIALSCCFFHLMQCVWRRCQSLGLTVAYETDHEASMCIRMLPSLAFVPPANVVRAHNEIQADAAVRVVHGRFPALALTLQLTAYFERNFLLGRARGAGGAGPRYPIPLWSCYGRCIAGLPRTNNGVEGWHRGFNESVAIRHPHLWHLLNVIRDEFGSATNEQVKFDRLPNVHPTPPKPRDRATNRRVLLLVQNYNPARHYDYCRAIAYTFSLT